VPELPRQEAAPAAVLPRAQAQEAEVQRPLATHVRTVGVPAERGVIEVDGRATLFRRSVDRSPDMSNKRTATVALEWRDRYGTARGSGKLSITLTLSTGS